MVKYYIRLNKDKKIIKTFTSAFEEAIESDILIGEGIDSQFRATKEVLSEELQEFANVENGLNFVNEQGLYCLKYEQGLISKVSKSELEEELNNLPKPKPTQLEILEQENIMLMETTVELYETNLEQEKQIKDLKQENVEMMLALTEVYENIL